MAEARWVFLIEKQTKSCFDNLDCGKCAVYASKRTARHSKTALVKALFKVVLGGRYVKISYHQVPLCGVFKNGLHWYHFRHELNVQEL